MLSTNKLRSIYSKIQTQLFYMIPEKWDKICLYASIIEQVNHLETGEMFFYYYPTGILKKNPVNVYEIPNKFNIDEEEYMKLVDKLYSTISELREAFKQSTEEKMWTNLTITIQNFKFNVEYSYEDLIGSKYTSYDRHIIWKCKYLGLPLERLTKKDRKMVEEYNIQEKFEDQETKTYTEGMYKNKVHNIVEYNKEITKSEYEVNKISDENDEKEINKQNRKDIEVERSRATNKSKHIGDSIARPKNEKYSHEKKKADKYELYKQKQEEKKKKEDEEKENMKNQILKI